MSPARPEVAGDVRWTADQLKIALGVNFGFNRSGRVDAANAAQWLGVSPSSVRRWLRPRADGAADIAASRLGEVLAAVRPTEQTYRDQALVLRNAEAALATVRKPRGHRRQLTIWRQQGWLGPYIVAIIEPRNAPVQQVTVSGRSDKALDHFIRRGREIADLTVDTKFAALIVAQAVLAELDPWRIDVPSAWNLDGRTQVWVPGAPLPDLGQLADDRGLA